MPHASERRGFAAPNYTQVPNRYLEELLPEIDTLAELKVTLAVFRQTFGWHERGETISLTQLQQATGLARDGVVRGVRAALMRGTIDRVKAGGSFEYRVDVWFDSPTTASSDIQPAASSAIQPPIKKPLERKAGSAKSGTRGVGGGPGEAVRKKLIGE